jgi:type I restriction enzyme M protein
VSKRHSRGKDARGAVARIEEIVLASSGADAFELVFALAAGRLMGPKVTSADRRTVSAAVSAARVRWPWLRVRAALDVPNEVLAEVARLLDAALGEGPLGDGLDAVFEQLVTRVGKGEKGQFFTPRHVVDFAVRALWAAPGETVVDPACGSGAFLAHARALEPRVVTWGSDVDLRAVRIAKLLALATGADPDARVRADSLAEGAPWPARVDVVATNPPFAGDHPRAGYELTRIVRAERDALFLERATLGLRPGGRMAIVLPHGKVASPAWAPLRRWLVERARVFAVVSLPKETFMPHTSQRTALVFAKKRHARGAGERERVFFAVSERAGKDAAGEPILKGGVLDHDLAEIAARLDPFLAAEHFRLADPWKDEAVCSG